MKIISEHEIVTLLKKDHEDREGIPDYVKIARRAMNDRYELGRLKQIWLEFIPRIPTDLDWPLFCRYSYFAREAKILDGQYYGALAQFLRTDWQEEAYPGKEWLRAAVIREFDKQLSQHLSYKWIKETSPIVYRDFPWLALDLECHFNKEHALDYIDAILKNCSSKAHEDENLRYLHNNGINLCINYSIDIIKSKADTWANYFHGKNRVLFEKIFNSYSQDVIDRIKKERVE